MNLGFSLRIINYAREHNIIILLLLPNATHLMRVGDVAIHAPFKKRLGTETGMYQAAHPFQPISRFEYARIIAPAYIQSFTPSNILAGYTATGINPINPDKVLTQLSNTGHRRTLSAPTVLQSIAQFGITINDVLSVPGQGPVKAKSNRRRKGIPFTRVLTSDEMLVYFTEQEQLKKKPTIAKVPKRRLTPAKRKAKSSTPTSTVPADATISAGDEKKEERSNSDGDSDKENAPSDTQEFQ